MMTHTSYGRINSNTSSEKGESSWHHEPCGQHFRGEFRVRNFLLCHNLPGLFGRARCGTSLIYLVWRFVWAAYHVAAISTSGYMERYFASREENRVKWFIFLTNWCYLLLTVTAILDLIVSMHFYINRQDFLKGVEAPLPWYCKVFWTMSNINNAIGIEISVIYWVLLHDFSIGFWGHRILPFLTHGMNVIYILLNLMVTAMPVRLLHFYQPAVFGLIYVIFSLVYTICGGSNDVDEPYIYAILDWNNTPSLTAAITSGTVFGAILIHIVVYFLYLVRTQLFGSCQDSDHEDEVIV